MKNQSINKSNNIFDGQNVPDLIIKTSPLCQTQAKYLGEKSSIENMILEEIVKPQNFLQLSHQYFLPKFALQMTDLIDLNYQQAKITSKRSTSSYSPFYQQQTAKVYCIHHVIQKFVNKIDKINIKTVEYYVFQLDKTKVLFRDIFYYYPVKIVGVISLGNGIFSLIIQFFDQKGSKISAKTHHHRTVISSFAFQINAELENFRLQHNPVSGQFSFVFNIKAQYLDKALVSELVQFALDSYFQECPAHFYILHLIQYVDGIQNQYLKSVEEDFDFLKQWVRERQIQNRKVLESYSFYEKFQMKLQTQQTNRNQKNIPKRPPRNIKMIEKYLDLGSDSLNIGQELCAYRVRHIYKRFRQYYEENSITRSFLASKIKYQHILTVSPKQTQSLLEFMKGKSVLKEIEAEDNKKNLISAERSLNGADSNLFSPKSSKQFQELDQEDKSEGDTNEEVLRVWDKETGKCYCVKMLHLKSSVKNQNFFVQKLCKFESYYFINQYVQLQNYIMQNEFILVNVHPKRTTLSEFLQKNNKIISFSSRIHICINLIQIVYTLHMKNKIQNYFPQISIKNLQISRKMSLSFKTLSSLSVFPLYELINSISMIIFEVSFSIFKRDNAIRNQIVKGDEIQNKNWGLSLCIYFLRYYIVDISEEVFRMIQLNELKMNKKTTASENKDLDQWKKDKITRTCEELLVIFSHFQNISSRGYEESYSFEETSDSDEVSDPVEVQT